MQRLVFDIETDGFTSTKIHCLVIVDADNPDNRWVFDPDGGDIEVGLSMLADADEIIGHNIVAFDLPQIQLVYPNFSYDGVKVTDTLVLSRLIKANQTADDYDAGYTLEQMPKRLYGSHSLKAWGLRLGLLKGDFGEGQDWSCWTPEMTTYCIRDVEVTHLLWKALAPHKWSQESIELEHEMARICHQIGRTGWVFDIIKAGSLYATLAREQQELQSQLQTLFPPWQVETQFIPKANNSRYGYIKGEPFTKVHTVEFNPASRKHIAFCLRQKYGWKPTEFTPAGDAKVDESVLSRLDYPEARTLARSFLIQKRVGQLAEGANAWLKLVDSDGRLRHTINPNGAVSSRATHHGPNLAQVPSLSVEFGAECRELFGVPPGFQLVGSDLSGLELRCLSHFLQDNGAYAKEVINGDIHTANMAAFGLTDRSAAKRAVYCLIYGGGNAKLGEAVGGSAADGRRVRDNFLNANPAFASLLRAVANTAETRGYLIGLDGRQLPVRSPHAALNLLLQSAGALICKKWVQLSHYALQDIRDAKIVGWIHDEVQVMCRKGDGDNVGHRLREAAAASGQHFKFTVPIDAEYTIGHSWRDTH